MSDQKPIHAKPALYALYFYPLKEIALKYGYNLVLHGSLNRDMDLIAIPWAKELKPHEEMIKEIAEFLGGYLLEESERQIENYANVYHGRKSYIINLNRSGKTPEGKYIDPQYYIDLSVTPAI